MSRIKEDTSPFLFEEETIFENDNTLVCFKSTEEEKETNLEDYIGEKRTTYFENKKDENSSETPVDSKPTDLEILVRDYENWEGRVVSTEKNLIRARIINTQHIYSPRILQISKSIFESKGISKELFVGDMFELTFKHVKIAFITKNQKFRYREENIDTIRLIEQVKKTRQEIDALVSSELQALSYLFE